MARIEFVEQRREVEFIPVPDHYRFEPRGRMQFLQRWAWRFLNWREALRQAVDQHATYTRHVIDTRDVMNRLMQQRVGLFNYGREPKELLIGAEEFADLMCSPAMSNMSMVSFTSEYRNRDGYGERIMGLKVTVVPWMRGMLVMP